MIAMFCAGFLFGGCAAWVLACLCRASRAGQDSADKEMMRRMEERGGRPHG